MVKCQSNLSKMECNRGDFVLIPMNREQFGNLDDAELGWACIEPAIQLVRSGQMSKSQVYAGLTSGQRALFMFRAYYNHAIQSLPEFYWWSSYFLAWQNAWKEIKAGLHYFEDDAMIQLFIETETALLSRNPPQRLEEFQIPHDDLDYDEDLRAMVIPLYNKFRELSPSTLNRMGEYVRHNPLEFVQFTK